MFGVTAAATVSVAVAVIAFAIVLLLLLMLLCCVFVSVNHFCSANSVIKTKNCVCSLLLKSYQPRLRYRYYIKLKLT